ncbi:uncharacterized protein [Cicer arietinum]|uniref:Myb family transcription factor At1g14600 isoform X2 n=1 Tax=Cicer arietinum TaxID=3827 RepID=A0A1S2XPD4_CICAR|nr:putative Myb family transcription factor At1g14600 isoform X2 [Cicer arietinum]
MEDMREEKTYGSECSKTSVSNEVDGCEISEENHEDEESKQNNINEGLSSSNSTIEENNEKKSSVRPYVRSKFPRLRWTPDLHLRFIHAVQRLGGQERATPKLVLQLMNIKGLSIAHVKSHLQMYRSKKVVDTNQDNGDKNVYNLSQLPMLQGYTPNQSSSYRCGYEPIMMERSNNHMVNMDHSIFQVDSSHFREQSSRSKVHEPNDNFLSFCGHDLQDHPRAQDLMLKDNLLANQVEPNTLKRKASDVEVDLDLSLKLNSRNYQGNIEEHEVDSKLSLSLYSQSSSSYLGSKMKEKDVSKEQGKIRGNNIVLDLTI